VGKVKRVKNPATLAENVTEAVVRIFSRDYVFDLREPINLTVGREGAYYVIEHEPLGLMAHGKGFEEALRAFASVFAFTWEEIAMADDRKLDLNARKLKRAMLKLVQSVQAAAA
jgi:predicted RNase H-like HicB family nuclease